MKILYVAFALIGISVIGNIVLYALGYSPFNLITIDDKQSISSKDKEKIYISSTSGDIKVIPTDGESIYIEMVGKAEKKAKNDFSLSIKTLNDEIHVKAIQKEKKRFFVLNPGAYELLVKVPRRKFDTLHVDSGSANLNLSRIEANNYELKALAGNITVNQAKGKVDAETAVGDINLNMEYISNDIEAKTTTGNITVKTQKIPEVYRTNLKSSFGNKIVDLPNVDNDSVGVNGPLVKLSSIDGDLAILMSNK